MEKYYKSIKIYSSQSQFYKEIMRDFMNKNPGAVEIQLKRIVQDDGIIYTFELAF